VRYFAQNACPRCYSILVWSFNLKKGIFYWCLDCQCKINPISDIDGHSLDWKGLEDGYVLVWREEAI